MRNAHFASRGGSTGVARRGPKIAHHKQLQHLPGLQGGREGCDTFLGTKATSQAASPPSQSAPREAHGHIGKVHKASPVTKHRDGKRVRWGAE